MRRRALAHAAALALAAAGTAAAQDSLPPWEGGLTTSLGQPTRYEWYAGGSLGADWRGPGSWSVTKLGVVGLMRNLTNPATGFLAVSLEGYGGLRLTAATGGARALVHLPALGVWGGVDYGVPLRRASAVFGLTLPVRRGGVVGKGSSLRGEWSPGASAVQLALLVPLGWPAAGRTRPRHAQVTPSTRRVPGERTPTEPAEFWDALDHVRRAALRIEELVVPALDVRGGDPRRALAPLFERVRQAALLPGVAPGPDVQVEAVVRAFHAELARAFAIAATGAPVAVGRRSDTGEAIEARARRVVLDHVLFPFDRLLGQRKPEGALRSFWTFARGNFAGELARDSLVSAERSGAVSYVFEAYLDAVDAAGRQAAARWPDSRDLWLPLQLGLLPEEHDTQAELDDLVQRAVGQRFTDGNRVWYVVNEHLQAAVQRSILDARDYHVLWIHDFRGVTERGRPDRMSLRYVVEAYLGALVERVRAYDAVAPHRLPVYMIFLDEHYYEVNAGRLWLDVLEHPLRPMRRLPRGYEAFDSLVAAKQEELREAIAGSTVLQAERRRFGDVWLENLVKVHVNITNPADRSFRAPGILPLVGFGDDWIRDHRKIVFYDVTEADPYRGRAFYTGIGVGEHYSGPQWEDRAVVVEGPALKTLKDQARALLLSQGLRPDQVPYPLRPVERAPDYDRLVAAEVAEQARNGIFGQRAMELHNGTGYQPKAIDVAKATLYTLMPRGSVLKIPDSLWSSTLYAALLAGSALRGARVLVIAPSFAAAPSFGFPAMALAHDLMAKLVVFQQELGPELEAGGGYLKTGVYNPGIGVQNVVARFQAAYRNGRRTPFIRRLLPFGPTVDSMLLNELGALAVQQGGAGQCAGQLPADTVMPKLHLKANFFATREAWDSLATGVGVARAIMAYVGQLCGPEPALDRAQALSRASQALVDELLAGRTPEEAQRVAYFMSVGSANQDYRSMYLDGEASVLLSGRSAVVGVVDFALLASLSVWVDDLATLDELLPPPSGLQRAIARWVRVLL